MTRLCLPLLILVHFSAFSRAEPPQLPPPASRDVDFDRDVQPILVQHCSKCHANGKDKGGLSLADGKSALAGGNSGVVIQPGKSAGSKLILAVASHEKDSVMPPGEAQKLSAAEIGILRKWIDVGAKWGTTAVASKPNSPANHWSFQPIRRAMVPAGKHPVDHFVDIGLEALKLKALPKADRTTLIRRLSLDLIGLPPSPQEVDAFFEDESPNAYEKLVDRLLASPHFGERWGRHWLDVARYADSDGYEKDSARPFAWRYRDWVIQALNQDMPFDQFTIEQLAGDLLPNASIEQKTATGFHRNTLTNKEGGVDQEEFRVAAVVDRVNTTATTWLGLTIGCAQCHDHKYDPISQREFYQLFAFFNSDREVDLSAPLPDEVEKLKAASAEAEKERQKLKAEIEEAKAKNLSTSVLVKREAALAAFEKKQPSASKVQTLAMSAKRPTNVLIRGDFLRKGVAVSPGTPRVLPAAKAAVATRLDLARWLVSPDNPLTPRVTANWVWAKLFGRGLVATPEDFGTQGEKPSHPELLDFLAESLRHDHRWSIKKLIRQIVMSDAYQRTSEFPPELQSQDPLNIYLARQVRLRLEAEIVRDSALAVSGLLTRTVGGPSIRPPQPPGISELTYANSAKWVESKGPEKYKRGMYVWFQRTSPYPTQMTFDGPDSNVCAVRRERSNTPLQALTILNDAVFVEAAQAMAKRLLEETTGLAACCRTDHAFRLALGRDPTSIESRRVQQLFQELKASAAREPKQAEKLLGSYHPAGVDGAEAAAWVGICRALLNLDEFVTRE